MNIIVIAVISLSGIGLACAALIAVASKMMFVQVDARVEKICDCLPGVNCGACGFSGCEGYADALVKGEIASNLCPPGGSETCNQINSILGINDGEELANMTAIIHCLGDCEIMKDKLDYAGIHTCFAAKQLYGGQGACTFGCIGYGDCVSVCPSNAICVENNLAHIDSRRCSGCAVCQKVCPTGVISVISLKEGQTRPIEDSSGEKSFRYVAVLCKNTEKGSKLKDKCSRGCIGCMKCVKACPEEAITISESLAVIDHSKCNGCGKCVDVCVKKCIVSLYF